MKTLTQRVTGSATALSRSRAVTCQWLAILVTALFAFPVNAQSGEGLRETTGTLEDRIIARLYDKLRIEREEIQFSVKRQAFAESDWESPEAIDSLTVRPLLSAPPKGLYPVVVSIFRADGTRARGQVTLYASQYRTVFTLKQDMRRGDKPTSEAVSKEFRDITKLLERPVDALSDVTDKRFRRNARRGAIVTREMLEAIPVITNGDEVLINYRKGALQLTARGKALGKGIIGEKIRVQNLSSRKVLTAMITGVGAVSLGTPPGGKRASQ